VGGSAHPRHSTGRRPPRQQRPRAGPHQVVTRRSRANGGQPWGKLLTSCEIAVDDTRIPGDCGKTWWITLGIRKYRLTWCFPFAKVILVPGSACQTEPARRVDRSRSSDRWRATTRPGHEVEASPDGARSHSRSSAVRLPVRRAAAADGRFGSSSERYPNYLLGGDRTASPCDGTGNRVSVNGVEEPTEPGSPGRPRVRPATGSASAGDGVGNSGNGGRFADQPGRGGTAIGQPMWRRRRRSRIRPADRASLR